MPPLLEESDRTDERDDWLRGFFAGVCVACLAVLIVAGCIAAGLR